ncbi:large conductance mechanosensitive channel protein MscL [Roseovarius sp.]|uniref:large conductance mechanosensitive channel protein MscL n=1 Tax=Roseovarius sp. TaxID=1486281 RepID=UPI00262A4118|nr:large conductance mechanosensitive channel protein MscL [Roseovarius sp.]MDM8168771.1 large conductance mechanosensitive channel protein MscL [Roseovarius sp.]
MLSEFRTFISRGNVMDMAVGIIIGAAFTAIVSSLVADLIDPVIGLFLGGVDFSDLFVVLGAGEYPSIVEAEEAGAAIFAYGRFIMAVINFLIIAFVVFLLVKGVNSLKRKEEKKPDPAPAGPTELDLLKEIRDALKK